MSATKRLVPHVPLSGTQRFVWFTQACADRPALNDPVGLRLSGRLDVSALATALSTVASRHHALATSLVLREGVPVLASDGGSRPDLVVTSVLPGADLDALVDESLEAPDPVVGPFMRVRLISASDEDHTLLLTTHRLVSDYQSNVMLMSELSEVYAAVVSGQPPQLPEPSVQYPDFARWQQAWLASPVGQQELDRWESRLAGLPTLDLPADHHRRASGSPRAGRVCRVVGGHLPPPATLPAMLATALAAVLTRHTRNDEVVLGLFGGPPNPALRRSVGPFDDPVVLRLDTSGDPTLAELLARTRTAMDRATRQPTVPFAEIVERLEPRRDLDRHPVFQVGLAVREGRTVRFPGLRVEPLDLTTGDLAADALDLSVTATRTDDGLELAVRYRADLFDRWRIERLVDHLVGAFDTVRDEPGRRLALIDLLSDMERDQVLSGWHGRCRPIPDTPVHALVAEQAARTPEAVAVTDATGGLTYRELDLRSNRLANHLRSLGVGPGVLVAVFLPRDVEMVVTLLAVLKAGGAYVPLDLGYPAGRIEMILHDARAGLVLTRSTLRSRLPDTGSATIVPLDLHDQLVAAAGDQDPEVGFDPDRLCHVVFTSGSTGRPKGVATCHRNVTGYLSGLLAVVEPDRFARVLFSTAASFDACLVELWPPLLVGGTLVVVDNLLLVSDQVDHHDDVTLINTVPSVLAEYLRLGRLPRGLRTLTIG
ncbi:MAG TPA: AMP-binding protein, partial [Mycobacteriales bacterium]